MKGNAKIENASRETTFKKQGERLCVKENGSSEGRG